MTLADEDTNSLAIHGYMAIQVAPVGGQLSGAIILHYRETLMGRWYLEFCREKIVTIERKNVIFFLAVQNTQKVNLSLTQSVTH